MTWQVLQDEVRDVGANASVRRLPPHSGIKIIGSEYPTPVPHLQKTTGEITCDCEECRTDDIRTAIA